MTPHEWGNLWQLFRKRMQGKPFAAIWRVELQQRGQPHLHLVCWSTLATGHLILAWWQALGARMHVQGAYDHSACVDENIGGDDSAWWRYLASHTGKRKQAQSGWQGRQWGVFQPQHLKKGLCSTHGISLKQWHWVKRRLRTLTGYRGAGNGRKTVWYIRPDTITALIAMARQA
jgi:hypothetical protein